MIWKRLGPVEGVSWGAKFQVGNSQVNKCPAVGLGVLLQGWSQFAIFRLLMKV